MDKKLIVNRWETPDGTILESKHTHDFVKHKDKNGDEYFIDGGIEYVRSSVNDVPLKNLCLYTDDDFAEIRKCLKRGTVIPTREDYEEIIWIPLYKMSDAHLVNCILYVYNMSETIQYNPYVDMYINELLYRIETNISLSYTYSKYLINKEPKYKSVNMCNNNNSSECLDIKDIMVLLNSYEINIHTSNVYNALKLLKKLINE